MRKGMIRLFGILLPLFLFPALIGCFLHRSGTCTSFDPVFQGCYQRTTDPMGRINIIVPADSCNQLTGMGQGLFDAGGGNDSYTVLLIHGNTEPIVDDSVRSKMITPNGNAMVQGVSRFGGGAISFDGTEDYLSIGNYADFNFSSGIWTVDMWVRITSLASPSYIWGQITNTDNYILGSIDTDGAVILSKIGGSGPPVYINTVTMPIIPMTPLSIDINTWYHIEFVENFNNYYVLVNGMQWGFTNSINRTNNAPGNFNIGYPGFGSVYYTGYMDEIRVSRIARHAANFTPPTEEYSGWEDVGWSFTGNVTAAGRATLNITREGGTMYAVTADRTTIPNTLTLRRVVGDTTPIVLTRTGDICP